MDGNFFLPVVSLVMKSRNFTSLQRAGGIGESCTSQARQCGTPSHRVPLLNDEV